MKKQNCPWHNYWSGKKHSIFLRALLHHVLLMHQQPAVLLSTHLEQLEKV